MAGNIPASVKTKAHAWLKAWELSHPMWAKRNLHADIWYGLEGYDLNLYCEDGHLSLCVYEAEEGVPAGYNNAVYRIAKEATL